MTRQHPHHVDRLGRALVALGGGLALNSVLGPLGLAIVEYRYGASMTNQAVGLDAVALLVAAPLAVVAAVLVSRRHRAGAVLALAPSTFAAYMLPQYVIGPDYLGLPGNNERAIPFHLTMLVLAIGTAIAAWRRVCDDAAQGVLEFEPTSDRRRAWVLLGLAGFVALGRWLPALVDALRAEPRGAAYLDNPTAFWLIALLDLAVVVPAAVTAAIGLLRGAPWAGAAGYAVIGWFCLVPVSVAAMAISMQVRADPLASTGNTVTVTVAGVIFTAAAAAAYRPLFGSDAAAPAAPSAPGDRALAAPSGR